MNIYVTHFNPLECAKSLDDATLVLGLKHAAQALSSACSLLGVWNFAMHPAISTAHPIPGWVAGSKNNFRWTYHYGKGMSDEYRFRFDQEHPEEKFIRTCWFAFKLKGDRPLKREMTPFVNLTNHTTSGQTYLAYRQMLCEFLWNENSSWTKRMKPSWFYSPQIQQRSNLL